jgi:Zn-dependent protease
MGTGRIRLFTTMGIPVFVHVSWLLIAALITWSLATGLFVSELPDVARETRWLLGALGSIGLFVSIVLHELSHSFFALRAGVKIKGITLFLFGGVAEMTDEPPSARDELVIALAGPAMSLVIAGGAYLLSLVVVLGDPARALFAYMAVLNGTLAVFNLIPAFPLDGGRAFRALLWAKNRDLAKATRTAARVGTAFAHALLALGVVVIISGDFVSGLWICMMGLFLKNAAQGSVASQTTRSAFAGEPVTRFMAPGLVAATTRLTVEEFVDTLLYRFHYQVFPVVEDGVLLGTVGAKDVSRLPRDEWSTTPIGRILKPVDARATIAHDEDALAALTRMQETSHTHLIVVKPGRHIVGIVTLRDLLSVLSIKLTLAGASDAEGARPTRP